MKKLLSLALTLALLLPAAGFAEERRTTREDGSDEVIKINGEGTAIVSADVPFQASKVAVSGKPGISAEIQGQYTVSLRGEYTGYAEELMQDSGSVTCMITADGEWTVTFSRLDPNGGIPEMSGNKGAVSDAFILDAPTIIHVTARVADVYEDFDDFDEDDEFEDVSGYFSVFLYAHTKAGWNRTGSEIHEFCMGGERIDADLILNPADSVYGEADMFVLYIQDDIGAEWSITSK